MSLSPGDPAAALRRVDLFAQLSEAELAALARLLTRKRCHAGQVIFVRGDPGDALYLIVSGRAHVTLSSPVGKEVLLTVLGPGDIFGDLALLDGEPRSADVAARDDCDLLMLRRSDFLEFLGAHPGAAKQLLAVMSRRLRHNADLIEEVAFLDIGARLARLLLGLVAEGTQECVDNLNQTELAGMIGATRESVNKWLAAYQRQGLVAWQKQRLLILNTEGLRDAARL